MATALIWYHDSALLDANGLGTIVIKEPSVVAGDQAESVTVPGASAPAPNGTNFAVVEADADFRYTVRAEGQTTEATQTHKIFYRGVGQIGVSAGQTIHFVEDAV